MAQVKMHTDKVSDLLVACVFLPVDGGHVLNFSKSFKCFCSKHLNLSIKMQ